MTVTTNVSVYGAQDAIKALKNVDPEARKQFTKDVKNIAKPITEPAKRSYPASYLSNMDNNWNYKGREVKPYNRANAIKGVAVKIDLGKKSTSVIRIQQKDPWGSIVEFAGAKTSGTFVDNLTAKFGQPPRVMWKTADKALNAVSKEILDSLEKVMSATNRRLVTK
jgi:hypothetical protein